MAFGIYVHIPHCLQICSYCDFAKYEVSKIPSTRHYTDLLLKELNKKFKSVPQEAVTSVYFGGGTPSLLSKEEISNILSSLKERFIFSPDVEITLEINPGTLSETDFLDLKSLGVNRFSVGIQTLKPHLLKITNRKHSVEDSFETLSILNKLGLNFSADILYSLPGQSVKDLKEDLETLCGKYEPQHISCYYLTVPHYHPLQKGRAPEEEQEQMMDLLEGTLSQYGIYRYEISNFSKPGFESAHNLIYWKDSPYWGLGLSAHSYLKPKNLPHGTRFWNSKNYFSYEKYVHELKDNCSFLDGLDSSQIELLNTYQALTDFFHTFLRKTEGFCIQDFESKFDFSINTCLSRLDKLIQKNLLEFSDQRFKLTVLGRKLPNLVYEELTFLSGDLDMNLCKQHIVHKSL